MAGLRARSIGRLRPESEHAKQAHFQADARRRRQGDVT
jgi:hypothetical protein